MVTVTQNWIHGHYKNNLVIVADRISTQKEANASYCLF